MPSKKKKEFPQGNNPKDDPRKFGLKFDGGKSRWDLVPMTELKTIISVPQTLINNGLSYELTMFNMNDIYNITMHHITEYILHENQFDLIMTGYLMFYMLRGKPYTTEEINASKAMFRWDLFDINEIQKVVDVYTYGAKLYADNNWQNVSKQRYISALLRHFKTVRSKSRFDDESGYLHLHHAIWNVLSLMWISNKEIKARHPKAWCSWNIGKLITVTKKAPR